MAGGPTVTLTFAGDADKLNKAFSSVGDKADGMARDVGSASDRMRSAGGGFDSAGEAADGAEGKFQGVADTLTGFSDIAQGFQTGSVLTLAMGFADLAGGAAQLLPLVGGLATTLRVGLASAMTFVAANPLVIVLGVVLAILIALWFASDDFREAVIRLATQAWSFLTEKLGGAWNFVKNAAIGFWNWVSGLPGRIAGMVASVARSISNLATGAWRTLTSAFGRAVSWVRSTVGGLVNWFGSLPGRIGSVFSGIGNGIKNALRSAFNFVARAWNNTVGRIGFSVPSWVPGIGGNHFGVPNIPYFHRGGVVPGVPGSETLAMLQAGERVTPAGSRSEAGGVATIRFAGGTDQAFATAFMKLVRTGQIQIQVA